MANLDDIDNKVRCSFEAYMSKSSKNHRTQIHKLTTNAMSANNVKRVVLSFRSRHFLLFSFIPRGTVWRRFTETKIKFESPKSISYHFWLFEEYLSNDPGKVDSNFFCYAATVLSSCRNVLIFTQGMHKPT